MNFWASDDRKNYNLDMFRVLFKEDLPYLIKSPRLGILPENFQKYGGARTALCDEEIIPKIIGEFPVSTYSELSFQDRKYALLHGEATIEIFSSIKELSANFYQEGNMMGQSVGINNSPPKKQKTESDKALSL